MVHRVDGLERGLYMFVRDAPHSGSKAIDASRMAVAEDRTDHLPLYLLLPYDLRDAAKLICCHQDIGADSCFALAMIARFEVASHEPWHYRRLSGSGMPDTSSI